jgi:hypothetical protein
MQWYEDTVWGKDKKYAVYKMIYSIYWYCQLNNSGMKRR